MIRPRVWVAGVAALVCLGTAGGASAVSLPSLPSVPSLSGASSDPYCTGSYGGLPARAARAPLRFGIDPGLAGSAGGVQLPTVPDDPARDQAAVKALRPPGRVLVLRLNRLMWADGASGIVAFKRMVATYTRAGFEVELQVRYHPASGDAGNIGKWVRYVRHVVDVFGRYRRVVSLTITNEVNVTFSPNTSDGAYARAEDALIKGIEAARAEARRRGFHQLRFGFTYAYRFSPSGDAAFFSYLGAHGGRAFRHALGFVGLDFYPGSIYPPMMAPGDSYRAELAQAAGVVRSCLDRKAGIGARIPIWITENGVPTGALSESQQAAALQQLVQAAHDYSATYGITDYRWFDLRDSTSNPPATLVGATFSSDGLLRANYTAKPSFAAYRSLIGALGAPASARRSAPARRHRLG